MKKSKLKKLFVGRRKQRAFVGITILVGLSLLSISGVRLWDWYTTTQRLNLPSPSATVTISDSTPDEAKVDVTKEAYVVPADQPRSLEIPTLSVNSFIQQVGIDQFGAIATPSNIHMTGWYNGSVKPGEDGISIIDGHVSGRYESAVFSDLKNIKQGEPLTILYGNNRRVDFTVVEVSQYAKEEASQHIFKKLPAVDQQLVLVTCGGTFNTSDQSYDQRVLVYAQKN